MPDKRTPAFDVPADVKKATQSGWVYRSEQTAAPAGAPAAARAAAPAAAATRARPKTWTSLMSELMIGHFAVPVCLIISALSPLRRTPSK